MSNDSTLVKITGLWKKQDKNGNDFFVGSIGSATIMIFKNTNKENENHPDYILNVTPQRKKEGAKNNEIPF